MVFLGTLVNGREATDHLSQTQLSDVNTAVSNAGAQGGNSSFTALQNLFAQLPGQQGRELSRECSDLQDRSQRMRAQSAVNWDSGGGYGNRAAPAMSQSGDLDPERIAQEIYPILVFRDRVIKAISITLDKVIFA